MTVSGSHSLLSESIAETHRGKTRRRAPRETSRIARLLQELAHCRVRSGEQQRVEWDPDLKELGHPREETETPVSAAHQEVEVLFDRRSMRSFEAPHSVTLCGPACADTRCDRQGGITTIPGSG